MATATLAELGLAGAKYMVKFGEREKLCDCVMHLVSDEHGHHFAVVDEGQTLLMSRMAARCLQDAGLLPPERKREHDD
jgi:hypothetical protein